MGQYTCVDDTLKCFEWLENYRKLTDPTTINLMKMYLRFLKTFLVSAEKLSTEEDTFFISYVQDWVQNAGKSIQLLCANAVDESKVTEAWHGKIEDLTSKIRTSYRSVLQLNNGTVSNICLVELIDSVSNNLNDLLVHKTKSIYEHSIKKQINILQVKFRFLRNFAWFSSQRCIEHQKLEHVLRIIEVVATTTACLLFQCLFEDTDTDTIMEKIDFSQVLLTIQLIEPELRYAYFRSLKFSLPSLLEGSSSMEIEEAIGFLCCFLNDLKELLSPKAYLMASARDHVCNLCEELNFLIAFLVDERKNAEDLLARTKAVATKTVHVIHLLLVSCKNEDDASGDDPYLLYDLLNEIDCIKKEMITDKYLDLWKSIRSNLIPKVNSLGLIDFLLRIVNVVLNNNTDSIDFFKHQLEIVKAELLSLRSLLCVNDIETEVTDVMHEAKHAIGALIIRESPRCLCLLQLSNVIIKIQAINNKVAASCVRDHIVEINSDPSSEIHMPSVKREMEVGLKDKETAAAQV